MAFVTDYGQGECNFNISIINQVMDKNRKESLMQDKINNTIESHQKLAFELKASLSGYLIDFSKEEKQEIQNRNESAKKKFNLNSHKMSVLFIGALCQLKGTSKGCDSLHIRITTKPLY